LYQQNARYQAFFLPASSLPPIFGAFPVIPSESMGNLSHLIRQQAKLRGRSRANVLAHQRLRHF
jgi:hypothetical protein